MTALFVALWRLLRPKPQPVENSPSVDWEELRAMWPHDIGGYE